MRLGSKKESGSEGRKRRKLEQSNALRSSEVLLSFLRQPPTQTQCEVPSTSSQSEVISTPSQCGIQSASAQSENSSSSPSREARVGSGSIDEPGLSRCSVLSSDSERNSDGNGAVSDSPSSAAPEDQSGMDSPFTVPAIRDRDLGLLEFHMTSQKLILSDGMRADIVKLGSQYFQNREGPFFPTDGRCMSRSMFLKRLGDGRGDTVVRSWLIYSPSKAAAYCFCCLLYGHRDKSDSALTRACGFKKWRKPERLDIHENSPNHRENFTEWKEFERNLRQNKVIDAELQTAYVSEKRKWRHLLTGILHCIKYLAMHNLPLRGHRENLNEDADNTGNFLGLIHLISNFDPLIREHVERCKTNPGTVSYLSKNIQNEFIHLMACEVRENLLSSIRRAKYYGLMVDSTPDIAHREQLSQVLRYVEIDYERKKVRIRESFLGFIQIRQKDAESLATTILAQLDKDNLSFANCRSQCYDNAPVMAGHESGVEKRLLAKNGLALFVNCDNHSLNLAAAWSARDEPVMVTFFATINSLYVFFSRSTSRWDKLKEAIPVSLKSEAETRWSSRCEAVKVVNSHLMDIIDLLGDISEDTNNTADTRSDARQELNRMVTYEFLTLQCFWCDLLIKIDRVQKRLQDPTMDFHNAAADLRSLRDNFTEKRSESVEEAIIEGKRLCAEYDVAFEKRRRRKKMMPGEECRGSGLTADDEMRRIMFGTIDRLIVEMDKRFKRLVDLDSKFGFLLATPELLYGPTDELSAKCSYFAQFYKSDVNGAELCREIYDCRMLLASRKETRLTTPEDLLNFIIQYGDESVFPNLRVSIQILLTIAVSIASCERSFSKLKLILSYLRASMTQERMVDLILLSVERETTEATDFDTVIESFAALKARRMRF